MSYTKVLALVTLGAVALGSPLTAAADSWPIACTFLPAQESMGRLNHCARREGEDEIRIRPAVAVEHAPPGTVSAVVVDGLLLYLISSGKTAPALWFDNGADYFVEGLARTVRAGKVGFVDKSLSEVISPRWDFAFPFESGLAVVCTGCRRAPAGEHSEVVGGYWGYIDRRGEVVVPLVHPREDLPSIEDLRGN
jgi:hypothetical protein